MTRLPMKRVRELLKSQGKALPTIPQDRRTLDLSPTYNRGEALFLYWLRLRGLDIPTPLCTEHGGQYEFDPKRHWKCDFAWLYPRKVVVEVNGSAHSFHDKRFRDYEKWNALQEAGFTLLHFAPEQIEDDPDKVLNTLRRVLGLEEQHA